MDCCKWRKDSVEFHYSVRKSSERVTGDDVDRNTGSLSIAREQNSENGWSERKWEWKVLRLRWVIPAIPSRLPEVKDATLYNLLSTVWDVQFNATRSLLHFCGESYASWERIAEENCYICSGKGHFTFLLSTRYSRQNEQLQWLFFFFFFFGNWLDMTYFQSEPYRFVMRSDALLMVMPSPRGANFNSNSA